jgi:hypothetical protein
LVDDQTFQPFLHFYPGLTHWLFQFDLDQKYGKIELLHAGACTSSLNLPVVEHLLCELNNRVLGNGLARGVPPHLSGFKSVDRDLVSFYMTLLRDNVLWNQSSLRDTTQHHFSGSCNCTLVLS